TVSVVDVNGVVVALARTPDAPIFGTDVSLQKARTALFFSRTDAARQLNQFNSPVASVVLAPPQPVGNNALGVPIGFCANIDQAFIQPSVFTDGTAWSSRGIGLIDRPFYPDGVDGEPHGPFSRQFPVWSPFNVGLQLDLSLDNIAQHLIFLRTGVAAVETPR